MRRDRCDATARYNIQLTVLPLIHPNVAGRAGQLRGEFDSATPFRHLVIDEFLTRDACSNLMTEFPPFDREHAHNEIDEIGGKAVFQRLRDLGPTYAQLDAMLRSSEFLNFVGQITGIPELIYDPKYVGGGTHENLHGQELDPHVDFNYHPNTELHRRLNLIVFLNPEWREEWGGALEFHLNPWLPPKEDPVKTVVPIANRCVIFETTETSWHGFKRIRLPADKRHLSRRSIAVYYYTKERPVNELAPAHSTVYVPRPLPAQIRAGYTLREDDVAAVETLIARRDGQIKFLYEREKEFSAVILGSMSFRLGRALTWPVRTCKRWIASRRRGSE